LDSLSRNPDNFRKDKVVVPGHQFMSSDNNGMTGKPKIEKVDVNKFAAVAGGVTIADLYAKKTSFSGKTIKVKGQVTKFSPEIMNKNWVHLQDGTENGGKFDLTVTTDATVKVGDIVCFEGKITLDKDIGQGYFYDILMEDAKW